MEPSKKAGRRAIQIPPGLIKIDLGGGVVVYTTNPEAIVSFTWNTGNAVGSWSGSAGAVAKARPKIASARPR